MNRKDLILNPYFVGGLCVLLLSQRHASQRRAGSGLETAESVELSIQGMVEKEYD